MIFYSAWIFFAGAVRALRATTLDMMVLVAVGSHTCWGTDCPALGVGTGWLYSVVVTLTGGGEVVYEAAKTPRRRANGWPTARRSGWSWSR
ncbi:MAG: hypothetical protein ACOH2F_06075 [Cellulomonas sp.]